MRILVVEDDRKIAGFLLKGFKENGFAVDHAADGQEGLELARQGHYAAAVVDVMLPNLSGLDLVATVRAEGHGLPVIILSAKAAVDDRITGLKAGADDYLVKPFAFSELLARVQSLLRRSQASDSVTVLEGADIAMNLLSRSVTRAGEQIELQSREFALLELFLRNPGRVLTKTLLLERLWDYSFDPQTNVVDVLVCRLRAKIDRPAGAKLIHTIRGAGYVFRSE